MTDDQLLEWFVSRRDAMALEVLVRRHGPLVWGVCRRVARDHHDAEDAFQATFLVLARKAASITSRELLANWLYGVACNTARKARAAATRRRQRERQVTEMPEPEVTQKDLWDGLQPLLDQELSRLPDKYRVPIVLCDLEGQTRKEAAQRLGLPEGTVASRLARARAMLAKRLAPHGLAVSGGTLAAVLSQNVASAAMPTAVVSSTIEAVTLVTAGQAAVSGLISAKVAALTEGVLKAMFLTKLKTVTAVLVAVAVVGAGAAGLIRQTYAVEGKTAGGGSKRATVTARADEAKAANKDAEEDRKKAEAEAERRAAEALQKADEAERRRVKLKQEATRATLVEIEKALKKLRDDTDEKTVIEALEEIEKAVSEMKKKAQEKSKETKKR